MTDRLTALVQKFEASEEASRSARSEAERCRDYYDGRQLTSEQIATLKKRRQPIVIENLIRPKVDYLCGLERQTRTDPKAYPRTAAHDDDADAATDALRYVADDQNLDVKRSAVFQNMLIEGFGGVEVGARQVRGGIDPDVQLIAWDRLFVDPHSAQPDFSDAEYLGFITWMDLGKAKRRWPDSVEALTQTYNNAAAASDTYDDKPRRTSWCDKGRKRVLIVTIYDRSEGEWTRAVYTQAGELEETAPSPWLDEDGQPECGLILQSAFVDRDNDRYGLTRDYMTLQDEVNKRRSKFLHLANSRPMRVDPGSGLSPEQARREFNRPDGVLMAGKGEIEDLTSHTMAAGHFQLLAEAKDAIQSVGPNATMQGKSGQDQSGRAILALQQGGMTEVAPLLDNLRHFNIRVFRAIWNRIRQFWTDERWVRVTDDEQNVRFAGMNTTKLSDAAMKIGEAMKSGQIDQQTAQQFAMQAQSDPAMMQPMNVIAEMDVDIQIDETTNTPTVQFEQFDQLTRLAPMMPPPIMPQFLEMLIEASSLRDKKKLREIMEQTKQAPPDPMQEAMQQMQLAGTQAGIEKTQSETAKNVATTEKLQVETATGAFQAGYAG